MECSNELLDIIKESANQQKRATKFCEYVKKWHPAVFNDALNYINKEISNG